MSRSTLIMGRGMRGSQVGGIASTQGGSGRTVGITISMGVLVRIICMDRGLHHKKSTYPWRDTSLGSMSATDLKGHHLFHQIMTKGLWRHRFTRIARCQRKGPSILGRRQNISAGQCMALRHFLFAVLVIIYCRCLWKNAWGGNKTGYSVGLALR